MNNNLAPSFFDIKKILPVLFLVVIAIIIYPYHQAAAWFGFIVAAYSTMANDSIQTLGTFLSSNKQMSWYWMWLVFGSILIIVTFYGWYTHGHALGFGRLDSIPEPTKFSFLAILAPVILVALTQLRIPISTTFLILSMFSNTAVIDQMLLKSLLGYICAFITAILLWGASKYFFINKSNNEYNKKTWQFAQWIATVFLWSFWLVQDTANMVSYLPRHVELTQLAIILVVVTFMFGFIMYQGGANIQEIVQEKKNSQDIRAATTIDATFALVLAIFTYLNNIPMSTTWVFLGVLGGRELIIRHDKLAIKLIINDIGRASIGIVVSLLLVLLAK